MPVVMCRSWSSCSFGREFSLFSSYYLVRCFLRQLGVCWRGRVSSLSPAVVVSRFGD